MRFFFSTEFAAATARPSSPVRLKTEFATCAACLLSFGVRAFFEWRHFLPGSHGIAYSKKKERLRIFSEAAPYLIRCLRSAGTQIVALNSSISSCD
jgi:hypothetical protein